MLWTDGYTAAQLLAVLPVLALVAFVLALKGRVVGWREAIVGGAVVWGVVLVGSTEALGAFGALTSTAVAVAWLMALAASVPLVLRPKHPVRVERPALPRDWPLLAVLGVLGAVAMVLGAIAVGTPPNTWDSMTYHMARLIHWQQDASIAPFPTNIPRQLYLQPGAEFALLHLQLLSGGDHLAGLVQWASMLGVLIGTSLIAEDLGAGRIGSVCAVVYAASLPIGILESTSTQNDYVVAFWLVCAITFGLRLIRPSHRRLSWANAAGFGASIGLALLTKATAYVLVLPVGLWIAISLTGRSGWRSWMVLAAAATIAVLLNVGFYARNVQVFGSPTGPPDEGAPSLRYINDALTPRLFVSNLVRDVGIHLNATPFTAINVRSVNVVRAIHGWLGVDIADPRTTWGGEIFAEQPAGLAFDENFASNPAHLILLLLALTWALLPRRDLSRTLAAYALVLLCGFLLFAAVLRWQPWGTRLELPFFALGAPLVGTIAERTLPRVTVWLSVGLLVAMLPWVAYNQARPLVGPRTVLGISRTAQYFTNRPNLRSAYLAAIARLVEQGCAQVGYISSGDGWEYPLWPLLQAESPGPVHIVHVGVRNASAAAGATGQIEPCAVLALGPNASDESIDVGGTVYRRTWARLDPNAVVDQVAVLSPDER